MRKITCLVLAVLIILSVCSCNYLGLSTSDTSSNVPGTTPEEQISEETEESSSQSTSITETVAEESITEEAVVTTEESEIIVPSFTLPVSKTELPPQTDPESHFLYGAVLPEGNYLLMSTVGDQYILYDELGHIIKAFHYHAYEEPLDYSGVLPLSAVHHYTDPRLTVNIDRDFDPLEPKFYDDFPGGYIMTIYEKIENAGDDENVDPDILDDPNYYEYSSDYSKKVLIYNNSDELLFSFSGTSLYAVDSNDKETAIFAKTHDYETGSSSLDVCVINIDGQVTSSYNFKNLPLSTRTQILSEEYFIAGSYDGPINVYDRSGGLIMEDVQPIEQLGLSVFTDQAALVANIYGYFIKDGVIYDNQLNKVAEGSLDSDGHMIPGVIYDVNGIPCTAAQNWNSPLDSKDPQVVAVGHLNDRTAIRTDFGEFEIESKNGTYVCSNNHIVIMNDNETYKMYDLQTGKLISTLPDQPYMVEVQDEYVLVSELNEDTYKMTYTVIDNGGKTRFESKGEQVSGTNGEFIALIRGPYHGIADLDGNWLIRGLTWEASRDASYSYGY
jgi:hypothetical protein